MSRDEQPIPIPDDLSSCQALVEQLAATIDELQREKDDWKLAYTELLQRAFRRRAERYLQDPNQLALDFGDSEVAADAAEGLAEAVEEVEQTIPEHTRRRRVRRKPSQERFPEHIVRYEVEAETSEEQTHCPEHGQRKRIGYDTTETLEIERPKLRVRVTKYPKFVCEGSPECGVASPERPTGLGEGNRYDTSVAAEVITAKYGKRSRPGGVFSINWSGHRGRCSATTVACRW